MQPTGELRRGVRLQRAAHQLEPLLQSTGARGVEELKAVLEGRADVAPVVRQRARDDDLEAKPERFVCGPPDVARLPGSVWGPANRMKIPCR